jgi:alkylation response protein AidB-like acyl-CoA dehydrogenase
MIPFPSTKADPVAERLRDEVRAFLDETLTSRTALEKADSWNGCDPAFSRAIGRRGWLGMTWPRQYGGAERPAHERYVVIEEMLAAGAPVGAHWIAERQSGPTLLKYGTERQKQEILPRIAAGEAYFCIGMSESEAGSDLASVRTTATRVSGGWRVTGSKLWTTNAHRSDFMILLCRTSGTPADRHHGLSQLLIDLRATEGPNIRPIVDSAGQHHFNEVHFDGAFVPTEALIGGEGQGWAQVMSELAFERSGPERFLSSFRLIVECLRTLDSSVTVTDDIVAMVAQLTSNLVVLRHLSRGVAAMLENREDCTVQAAIVKDLGTSFEQEVPELIRRVVGIEPDRTAACDFSSVLAHILLITPSFSLRGGTREILRGIIYRALAQA